MKIKHIALVGIIIMTLVGCSAMKQAVNRGVNFVASVGTNAVGLLDVTQPLVQDPSQPDDTNAVVVNPAIVGAAQGAATAFGGPYGLPIGAGIGVIVGIVGVIASQNRRKKANAK